MVIMNAPDAMSRRNAFAAFKKVTVLVLDALSYSFLYVYEFLTLFLFFQYMFC